MPDVSDLYPKPPQPQQGGALSGLMQNPLAIIPALSALQQMQITRQQAPALVQQPAAALQGQNIQNLTGEMQQQDAARRIIAAEIGAGLSGIENPTANDVHSLTAYAARSHPDIARRYPGIINSAADLVLRHPQGIKYGAGVLLNSGMSPGEASQRIPAPPDPLTGAARQEPVTAGNLRSAGGATPIALPPGSQESATAMQSDLIRAGNYSTEIFPLRQAFDKIKELGPGGTAPGSKGRQEFESFVYGLAPQLSQYLGVDASKIKNYAELEKYLTQAMQVRANNFGPHTNEGLATATTGSPNVHINDLAGQDLIQAAIGLRRMEQAQIIQASKAGPASYTNQKALFAAQQDPRAYQIDMMTPDQIKSLQKSLKGADRAKFNTSLRSAIDSGVISQPGR